MSSSSQNISQVISKNHTKSCSTFVFQRNIKIPFNVVIRGRDPLYLLLRLVLVRACGGLERQRFCYCQSLLQMLLLVFKNPKVSSLPDSPEETENIACCLNFFGWNPRINPISKVRDWGVGSILIESREANQISLFYSHASKAWWMVSEWFPHHGHTSSSMISFCFICFLTGIIFLHALQAKLLT